MQLRHQPAVVAVGAIELCLIPEIETFERRRRLEASMNEALIENGGKKRYEPPTLKTISLRPEEAVLGHCKIAGGGGGPQPPTCTALFCSSIGS